MIGGFRSDLSIASMIEGNFGNVSAGILFLKVAYQRKRWSATVQKLFPRVKPFIQMHIFCNKQLATVWIKICVNCNFIDNRVICYIKTQLKYPSLSKLSYGGSNFNKNVLFEQKAQI